MVERLLGQGGFGSTYLASDAQIQKPVAIKELTPFGLVHRDRDGAVRPYGDAHAAAFDAMKKSFLEEARLLARFRHPNLVSVLRYFEANGTAYMVMEYEPGTTLRAWMISRTGILTEDELEAILLPICSGLALLHAKHLIHRDIKPDNIILRSDGSPCLLDFGAAARFVRRSPNDLIEVIATPHYAPPEQLDPTGNQGPWTDLYAVGATFYELMTGSPPPTAQARQVQDSLVPVSEATSGRYSSRLLTLVDQCLALDVRERPSSVEALLAVLRLDDDRVFKRVLGDISLKMAEHFLNWSKPNQGLMADELAIFITAFPILDLAWRLGEGTPSRETFAHLLGLTRSPKPTLEEVFGRLVSKGFTRRNRQPTQSAVMGRLDLYAASYLLDRQAGEWTYDLIREQLVRTCIDSSHAADSAGFSSLMKDIIDRARGRVKRGFRKEFDRVAWRLDADGTWTKVLRQ